MLCHWDDDEVIGASLARYGEWAEEELFLLHQLIPQGGTILDVGANVGTHTIAFSRFVGPQGSIIAFDGQRAAYQIFSTNLMLNQCHNVTAHNVWVGAESLIEFKRDAPPTTVRNMGSVSMIGNTLQDADLVGPLSPQITVCIDSLELQECHLIKVDVEGMELQVFRGSLRTLSRLKPVIYFEQVNDTNLQDIMVLLEDLGYELHWHVARPFNVNNYRGSEENIFGSALETNIIAVHRSRVEQLDVLRPAALPMVTNSYPPPITVASEGWALPPHSYAELPPPVAHQGSATPASIKLCPMGDANPYLGQIDLERERFSALLQDRRKAQEIMEYLSTENQRLQQENSVLAATRPASDPQDNS